MRSDRDKPAKIWQSIERIERYTHSGQDTFFSNAEKQDAVIRNLQVIGEAAKDLSKDLRARYSEVKWREAAGLRDKIIHDYFDVDLQVVWDVVSTDLPELKMQIEKIRLEIDDKSHQAN